MKQIPSEANITAAMNELPNCMCNMNLTEAKDTLYPHLSYLLTGEDEPDSLTEMRALFNTVKGLRSLVEVQTYQANASS